MQCYLADQKFTGTVLGPNTLGTKTWTSTGTKPVPTANGAHNWKGMCTLILRTHWLTVGWQINMISLFQTNIRDEW